MPGFTLALEQIEANAGEIDPASEFQGHLQVLTQGFKEFVIAGAI